MSNATGAARVSSIVLTALMRWIGSPDMFPCWSKPPSDSNLSRSARELRITARGALMRNSRALRMRAACGFARLGNVARRCPATAQENKSLHLKSRPCHRRCAQVIASSACRLALPSATLGELFR
jgi:hypothetical protein